MARRLADDLGLLSRGTAAEAPRGLVDDIGLLGPAEAPPISVTGFEGLSTAEGVTIPPGTFRPLATVGKRVLQRLTESGQAVLDAPAALRGLVMGRETTLENLVTGQQPPGRLQDFFTILRAASSPFEPIFAPIGESLRTSAEEFGAPPGAAQLVGAGGEIAAGLALPFVRTAPTPVGRGLQRVGIGRTPEATLEAERALELGRQAGAVARKAGQPRVLEDDLGLIGRGEAAPVAPPIEPPAQPPQPKAPLPKAPPEPLPLGVTEPEVFERIEAIRRTTEDFRSGAEPGRVVVFDPESLEQGIKRPIGAISGQGKILDLVADVFDEVSAVKDVPPGRLVEAIIKDKENPTYMRLKRAVIDQLAREAEEFGPFVPEPPSPGGPMTARPGPGPEPLTGPILREPFSRQTVQAAEELFTRGGIRRDPNRLLSDQVTDLINQGRVPLGEVQSALAQHGLTMTDFATQLFRPAVGDAGRRLQALSVLAQRLKQAGIELPDLPPDVDEVVRAMGFWRRADNIRRGLLVTQPATAIRNAITQEARLGLDAMQSVFDATLQRIFTPGKVSSHPADGMELLLNVFRKGKKEQVNQILAAFPAEHHRLFARYSSDIARAARREEVTLSGADRAFLGTEKAVDVLNTLNRFQEWAFRRAVFQTKLAQRLRRKGTDLVELIEEGRAHEIPVEDIRAAVDKSLEFTFAQSPKFGTFSQKFISLVNAAPFSATLAVPFPRFLVNSLKFHLDFSPFGLLKLLAPGERAALAAGDTKVLSRAMIGSAMLGTAWQVRNSEFAGEKWYEVRAGGKTVDLRPFNPFAAYLFVADVAKRSREGTLGTFEAKDVAQGILSANVRAGTGLFLVDKLLDGLTATGTLKEGGRSLAGLAGETAGGFLVPLQPIQDVLAEFDEHRQIVREKRQEPFLGPIKARIPGLAETLPEAEIPTRAGPLRRQAPLLRQTTGLIIQDPKNPLERELDRLGFTRQEVLRSTGEPEADLLIARHMGPLAERALVPLVQSPGFQRLTDAQQAEMLRRGLLVVRESAFSLATQENPQLFFLLRVGQFPRRERMLLQESLGRPLGELVTPRGGR